MNSNTVSRALGLAIAVLGCVLAIGAMTFAGACVHDDGTASVCHTAQMAIASGGVAIVVLAVASIFAGNAKVSGTLLILAGACGVFAALAPGTLFGLCMMETMRCHVIMKPFSQFVGVAIAALGVIAGMRAIRARSKDSA